MVEIDLSLELQTEFIRKKISKKFPKSPLHSSSYEEIFEVHNSRFKTFSEVSNKTFFYNHKIAFIKLIILIPLILVFVINDFYKEIYENTTKSIAFWSIIVLLIILIVFTYAFFFKRKSVCIKTTNEFLIINSKKKVLWTDILITGIFKIPVVHQMETIVIIGTINEIFEVNITESEITAKDLIQIINMHKNVT
ncbi:hypothetical protein [Flavobacterium sp. GCM10027622]|uniref:hypothetical protein n=1 Tax=unclassified Flavobacterium TaxID=196869 RepID=UPI003606DD67